MNEHIGTILNQCAHVGPSTYAHFAAASNKPRLLHYYYVASPIPFHTNHERLCVGKGVCAASVSYE